MPTIIPVINIIKAPIYTVNKLGIFYLQISDIDIIIFLKFFQCSEWFQFKSVDS